MDNDKVKRDGILPDILAAVAWTFIVGIMLYCLCSCGVQKPVIEYRDSIHIEYRDRIVKDTVKFEVEKEVEKIVTRDSSSHLENKWAKSDAVVSEGFLTHTLESKPQVIQVPVEVHVTDTLVVEKEAQIIEKEVKVEKDLNWWQKFRLGAFWWLVAGLTGCLIWIFRKPLLALLKTVTGGIL